MQWSVLTIARGKWCSSALRTSSAQFYPCRLADVLPPQSALRAEGCRSVPFWSPSARLGLTRASSYDRMYEYIQQV